MPLFIFFFLDKSPEVELLPNMVALFLIIYLRNFHIFFHSWCTNIHFHQMCNSVPFSPHPHQHFHLLSFFYYSPLTAIRWYLIVRLIFISWMSIFSCIFWPFTCFFEICLFKSSVYFLIKLVFDIELYEFLIYLGC